MNHGEILRWAKKYDDKEDSYNRGDEADLRKKFREKKRVTKEDLIKAVKWKFQDGLEPRQKRILKYLDGEDSSYIEDVSKIAFKYDDDKIRLRLFSTIGGVGMAMGSVILAFYDPDNYGVLDIHAWRGLFGKEPKDIFTNDKHTIKFFNKLREISAETGVSCRTIEKAYFKKDKGESKPTKLKKQ